MALGWSTEGCTIEGTTEVMGDRWSLLVLRELFAGIRRFDQLTVRTAIPRQVLTDRLERLRRGRSCCVASPTRSPGSGAGTSTG